MSRRLQLPEDALTTQLCLDAFSEDVQTRIAARVTTSDLARLRAVNKACKALADNPEVRKASFKGTWGVTELFAEPRKPNFYLAAGLGNFVLKLKLGPKTPLTSVLVKFRTDTVTLRILNNCISDFTLQSRAHIYVPVSNRGQLVGRQVTFTYDPACGRQLIVLQDLLQASNILDGSLASGSCLRGTMDMLARAQTSPHGAPETRCNLDEIEMTDSQREALLKKLSRQMGRGLSIDEGTASYYLDLARGDMKQAFTMYKEDMAWEMENPRGMLPLRERIPL